MAEGKREAADAAECQVKILLSGKKIQMKSNRGRRCSFTDYINEYLRPLFLLLSGLRAVLWILCICCSGAGAVLRCVSTTVLV